MEEFSFDLQIVATKDMATKKKKLLEYTLQTDEFNDYVFWVLTLLSRCYYKSSISCILWDTYMYYILIHKCILSEIIYMHKF